MMRELWESLCKEFSPEKLSEVLLLAAPNFRPQQAPLEGAIKDDLFEEAVQIGVIELSPAQTVIVGAVRVGGELTARSSRRRQFDFAKRILRSENYSHDAGIFAFYDSKGRYRFSLVTATYHGTQRTFSPFRRYTFFVDPELPNKTFLQQMQRANFSTLEGMRETFSLEAVSDEFYKDFKKHFDALSASVQGTDDQRLKEDLALLFAIRIIFLGFVQKKGWLGDNPKFLQDFWEEYRQTGCSDTFYNEWLAPLFFDALSSPPGRKVAYGCAPFSKKTQEALQWAPYLNGELFKRKNGVDDLGLWIPDKPIGEFFDFLFQYNFTVEENELYDEELELNPEFLGIIFERLTNKDQGAVYTPRVEVDFMCRLALVKWLEQTTNIDKIDLYRLFFPEVGTGEAYEEYQKQGDFSPSEIRTLIERLENVTVCDPAAGSGAFEVGMLQVLDKVLQNLYSRNNTPLDLKSKAPKPLERKKAIIAKSLYGVEVKRTAVWINHLRLWLTLFVDMPDEYQYSFEPLLPNLTFKVRTGDSLVQRIGSKSFPVHGEIADLPREVKQRIAKLKQKKLEYFFNKNHDYRLIEQEELAIFKAILDEQIKRLQERVRSLVPNNQWQETMFLENPEQLELDFVNENQELAEKYKSQIADLEAQKKNLKHERPFVWSIEFPEIFFEGRGFDIVIGNPPYVNQLDIRDPNEILDSQAYKEALLEMVLLDFPEYFTLSPTQLDSFKPGRKPSGHSDLYTYFYVRSLRLLNRKGVHVFICSKAWLHDDYGAWLQEFFLRQVPLYFVIENQACRSFARADVNTVITVAGAPKGVSGSHVVRFVALRHPFEDVVLTDNLLAIEQATAVSGNEDFRVCPKTVRELLLEGCEGQADRNIFLSSNSVVTETAFAQTGDYKGNNWEAKYLRAPDIYYRILEKGKDKLVRLGEIADVRRGYTTGANEFFYLKFLGTGTGHGLLRVRNGAGWEGEIEEEFLKPVIKSPRECRRIAIVSENLTYRIFMCHKNKDELKGTKALEYIEWGEKQGYHMRRTLRSRRRWWDLGASSCPVAIWQKSVDDRHIQSVLLEDYLVDQRLYSVVAKGECSVEDLMVALNNFVFFLFKEVGGRRNLGQGALDTAVYEARMTMVVMPRFNCTFEQFLPLLNREINNVFTECGIDPESSKPIAEQEPRPLPDRKALDNIVFDALSLTEEERKDVYRAVCQLVWDRICQARSVKRNGK